MRPRGEVRQALAQAAMQVAGQGATWRALAHRAAVGLDAARRTVDNMLAAGELTVIGQARVPGVCRPLNLYAPAGQGSAPDAGHALQAVVRCWADFR